MTIDIGTTDLIFSSVILLMGGGFYYFYKKLSDTKKALLIKYVDLKEELKTSKEEKESIESNSQLLMDENERLLSLLEETEVLSEAIIEKHEFIRASTQEAIDALGSHYMLDIYDQSDETGWYFNLMRSVANALNVNVQLPLKEFTNKIDTSLLGDELADSIGIPRDIRYSVADNNAFVNNDRYVDKQTKEAVRREIESRRMNRARANRV